MKGALLVVGVLLLILGTAVLTNQGVTLYLATQNQRLLSVGPVEASTARSTLSLYLTPLLGAVGMAAGVVLVFIGGYWSSTAVQNQKKT